MKLYSILILTKNTRKSKNNFNAMKKSEIVVFPGRILPCKQNKSAIFSTFHHIFPRIRRARGHSLPKRSGIDYVMYPGVRC